MKIKTYCIWFFVSVMISSSDSNGAETRRAVSDNCNLASPPIDAGEDAPHRTLLKVFPRKSKLGTDYSGCQTVWGMENGHWIAIFIGIFINGQFTQMKTPMKPGDIVEQCVKRDGTWVKGDEAICNGIDGLFPYSSVPAGCVSKNSSEFQSEVDCSYD